MPRSCSIGGSQDVDRGDVTAALASAEVVYDEIFTTAAVTNNPMGLFATVARWDGDRLTVHDSNQCPMMMRTALATVFDLPETDVRVLVPYLGGGFGAGLRAWPHVILTALAARVVGRPVKLVLTRPQMFTSVGHRPETLQRVRLGATRDGRLVALDHESTSTIGALDDGGIEPVTQVTGNAYACPNVATHDRRARLHIPSPHWMRGPGHDPGQLRGGVRARRAVLHTGHRPDRAAAAQLRRAFIRGRAARGRARHCGSATASAPNDSAGRGVRPRSDRCATGTGWSATEWPESRSRQARHAARPRCRSAATVRRTCAARPPTSAPAPTRSRHRSRPNCSDSTSTRCSVEIGDSDLPLAPYSGGSGMATSLSGAIHDAVGKLVRAFLDRRRRRRVVAAAGQESG